MTRRSGVAVARRAGARSAVRTHFHEIARLEVERQRVHAAQLTHSHERVRAEHARDRHVPRVGRRVSLSLSVGLGEFLSVA